MQQTNASSPKRVPKLRFPEFQDAPEWKEKKFADLYSLKTTNTLSRDKLNYESGTVKNIHYGDIHTKFSTLFRIEQENVPFINPTEPTQNIKEDGYCKVGDMVFADASEDLDDVGKSIEITSLNSEKVISGLHTILAHQKGKNLIVGFGGYLFKSKFLREQIQREAQGAKVLGISGGRLSNINVCFPTDEAEQQRIADCLSSLDEWIAADAKRLDALKEHKKGLMQQLFPAEGETTPKLRFPKFQNGLEWEKKTVGELMIVTSCRRVHQSDWTSEGVPFYRARELVALINKEPIEPLFISEELYHSNLKISGCIASIIWLKNDESSLTGAFLFFLYESQYVQQQITKMAGVGTVGTYTIDNAKNTLVSFPTDKAEQKRIADCLSSLDNLIAAQANKLNALKDHKKGLMQQLFPSGEEENSL